MNMAQETNPGQAPMLCSTGCGFYGNPRTNGMCSVCYKEHLQRQNGSSGRMSPATSPVVSLPESSPVPSLDDNTQESPPTETLTPAPAQPTPVSSHSPVSEPEACSQAENSTDDKIAAENEDLQGFECRCGNVFCGTHRYSDVHSCSYDYKADAAEKIRKENPVVVGEKVQKI